MTDAHDEAQSTCNSFLFFLWQIVLRHFIVLRLHASSLVPNTKPCHCPGLEDSNEAIVYLRVRAGSYT